MNLGTLNGSSLNGVFQTGANLTCSDGMGTTDVMSALLIAEARLLGGLFTEGEANGRVSTALLGGLQSDNEIDGWFRLTTWLQQGVHSGQALKGILGLPARLLYGVESDSAFGGDCVVSLESGSPLTWNPRQGVGMQRGFLSTSRLGNKMSITVRLQSGIVAVGEIDSPVMNIEARPYGGCSSSKSFGAKLSAAVVNSSGVFSSADDYGHLAIGAVLSSGCTETDTLSTPNIRVSPRLHQGFASNNALGGLVRSAIRLQDGVYSDIIFQSGYIKDCILSLGIANSEKMGTSLGWQDFCIGAVLSDGCASGSSFDAHISLLIWVRLSDGTNSSDSSGALLQLSPRLQGGVSHGSESVSGAQALSCVLTLSTGITGNTSLTDAQYQIGAVLPSGVSSLYEELGGKLLVCVNLTGGADSTERSGGLQRIDARLQGFGCSSTYRFYGDMYSPFTDLQLNTWALSLLSATEILSIATPLEDI